MSKTQNRNSFGLRFLWIPGKKKHHHKGRYDTVRKAPVILPKNRSNESWSLGGNKVHEDLIKSDASGETSGLGASSNCNSGIASGGGAIVALSAISTGDSVIACAVTGTNTTVTLNDTNEKSDTENKHLNLNGDAVAVLDDATEYDVNDTSITDPLFYNAETLVVGSKQQQKPNGAIRKKICITDQDDDFWYNKLPAISSVSQNQPQSINNYINPSLLSSSFPSSLISTSTAIITSPATAQERIDSTSIPIIPPILYHLQKQQQQHSCDNLYNFQKDLDIIEKLDDTVDCTESPTGAEAMTTNLPHIPETLYKNLRSDDPDTVAKINKKINKSKTTSKNDKNSDEKVDDVDEKTVKCLYYALMCCECAIS